MFICKFIWCLIKNLKLQRLLNKIYVDDKIIEKLSYALGAQFRRDWIGRLYCVVNPFIRDGKFQPEQILEYNERGELDNKQYIEQWIMTRLNIIQAFIRTNNLFDLLVYKIDLIRDDNYLLIIQPYTLKGTLKAAKNAAIELVCLVIILLVLFIFFI